jgi:hypothetical protein
MTAVERRFRRYGIRRLGTSTQLAAILLTAIFMAGLILIADGLFLKAEDEAADTGSRPTLMTEHRVDGAGLPPVQSR